MNLNFLSTKFQYYNINLVYYIDFFIIIFFVTLYYVLNVQNLVKNSLL